MAEMDPMLRGAGDIAFVAPYVPGLVGTGAMGEGAHAEGELLVVVQEFHGFGRLGEPVTAREPEAAESGPANDEATPGEDGPAQWPAPVLMR